MTEFVVEIATRSQAVADGLKALKEVNVTTSLNLTGEIVIVSAVALPLAGTLIREIGKIVKEQQATLRAQKLKVGKGTMSFEGFSPDEISSIIDKLAETGLGGSS